jgi:choline dehydrogenase
MSKEVFDYVIAGGGTAGCVLAARLTEDPTVRVLMLEAGREPRSLWIHMPAGMGRLFVNPRYNWGFETEPEPHLGGRKLYWPQGKTLGGSSAINGMGFVRGHAEDYDGWNLPGWRWDEVLPYFRRLESRADNDRRGGSGPLRVTDPIYVHPSSHAFRDAAASLGLPLNSDYNGVSQEGASLLQYTIAGGIRNSAARAYLSGARQRANLVVRTGAVAEKILFSNGRATGVAYRQGGELREATAAAEVIVTAGAIGSPRLLLLSGIGAGSALQDLGIQVVADVPGVGENLADHPYVHMTFGVRPGWSLNTLLHGWRVYLQGAKWLFTRRGPLTTGASQAVAFVRSDETVERPDLQINFRPFSHGYDSAGRMSVDTESRVTAGICALRPGSRGRVWLKSPFPGDTPLMVGKYLADSGDEDVLLAGVAWARKIFGARPLQPLVNSEDKPGTGVATEAQLREFIRTTLQTMCHPVGTCKMGTDAMAVVDENLRVKGVAGLRVVDSSIMPAIISGNTMAPTYMIAEKGADLIKASRNR